MQLHLGYIVKCDKTEDSRTFIPMSDELLACPIAKVIMSAELSDGHVRTRAMVSLKDVRVLDIISRIGNRWNGNRWNGNGSRRNRNGNQGSMLVWRSRSPIIHILITTVVTKNVNYFPADGEVENRSSSGCLGLCITSALQDMG
jgi:hypothetical protein